eukprot:TRINITY_DN17082_c0_g1_i1.p1 TRINITY_DN17082_c0_g1~~TRINITY_DN17082_c0_g1_i1.p1  ORF type:complete len:309 (-),score=33.21 TRINITY_DN17082_c0_g1_i1:42-968(-)
MNQRSKSLLLNGIFIGVFLIFMAALVSSYIYRLPTEATAAALVYSCTTYQGTTLECYDGTYHNEAKCEEIAINPPFGTNVLYNSQWQASNPVPTSVLQSMGVANNSQILIQTEFFCSDDELEEVLKDAPTFAYVVLGINVLAIAVMTRFAFYSKGRQRSLQSYYSCSGCLVISLIAIVAWILWNHPAKDAVTIVRIVGLFIIIFMAIFICSCIFVTQVTMTLTTHVTTYYVDTGRTSHSTHNEDFGFVYCRTWGCFDDSRPTPPSPAVIPVAAVHIEMPSIQSPPTSEVIVHAPQPMAMSQTPPTSNP